MNLSNYLDPLWLGTQASFYELVQAVEQARSFGPADWTALKQEAFRRVPDDEEEAPFGRYSNMVRQVGGTAVVSVAGKLVTRESWINDYVGLLSYTRLQGAVRTAADTEGIQRIVLDMATPGGAVSGISETLDALRAIGEKTPIHTYAGNQMASAGYWLGSVGEKIYTSKLASVGSIGVVAVHQEFSELLKEMGVNVTVFRQGKYKALGNPYEKLTDAAKAEIEADMAKVYGLFTETVAERRGLSLEKKETWAEGRVFFGYEAVANGLADAIMSLDEVLEVLEGRKKSGTANASVSLRGELSMKIKLTDEQTAALAEGAELSQVLTADQRGSLNDTEFKELQAAYGQGESAEGAEAADNNDDPEPTPDPAAAADDPEPAPAAAGESGLVDRLMDRNVKLHEANAQLKADLKAAQSKAEGLESSVGGLKEVVAAAINRMNVALGGAGDQANADTDADTLLSLHARTKKSFEERFPVGGKAVQPDSDTEKDQRAERYTPNLDAVRIRKA